MRHKYLCRGISFFLLIAFLFLLSPIEIKAQSTITPKLKTLTVSIWPEYDRPEVLVIYRAQLSDDSALPAQLTFRLPGYIEDIHAVATEQAGALVNIDPGVIELTRQGGDLLLTFPTSSPNFHLEYYDPVILHRQNQTRQLTFDFFAPYNIETTTFEIQQPVQAEDFLFVPEPVTTFTGHAGLRYSTVEAANLAPDDAFNLVVTYRRNTDKLSVQGLNGQESGQSVGISVLTESSNTTLPDLGYILVGAGIVLLLSTGSYWWLKQNRAKTRLRPQRQKSNRNQIRHRMQKKEPANKNRADENKAPSTAEAPGRVALHFCYHCGAILREDAKFCHVCGTQRRME